VEVIPAIGLAALVKKFVDFVKLALARDPGAITQLIAWGAGIAAVVLFAQSDWASGIQVADTTLADLNFWSQAIVGLGVSSAAGFGTDAVKALDDSDTARMPSLVARMHRRYQNGAA
jgi:hypothetical protein